MSLPLFGIEDDGPKPRRTTWVWCDTMKQGVCRSCGADVVFATNVKTGTPGIYNPPLAFLRTELQAWLPGERRQAGQIDLAGSHFATCPQSEFHRRPR